MVSLTHVETENKDAQDSERPPMISDKPQMTINSRGSGKSSRLVHVSLTAKSGDLQPLTGISSRLLPRLPLAASPGPSYKNTPRTIDRIQKGKALHHTSQFGTTKDPSHPTEFTGSEYTQSFRNISQSNKIEAHNKILTPNEHFTMDATYEYKGRLAPKITLKSQRLIRGHLYIQYKGNSNSRELAHNINSLQPHQAPKQTVGAKGNLNGDPSWEATTDFQNDHLLFEETKETKGYAIKETSKNMHEDLLRTCKQTKYKPDCFCPRCELLRKEWTEKRQRFLSS